MQSLLTTAVLLCVAQAAPPNVVVFFVDDMGYGDLGLYGAPTTSTPHIDQLGSEGAIFTQWYSAHAICTPSRAAMMTGRLPIRYGLASGRNGGQGVFACGSAYGIPHNETTMPEALRAEGYATAMVGKWHLGDRVEYLPTSHGFDEYLGVPFSDDMGLAYSNRTAEAEFEGQWYGCTPLPLLNGTKVLEQPVDLNGLTQKYTAFATDFVRRQVAKKVPFYLYFAFNHVHTPQYAATQNCGRSQRGIFGDSVEELDDAVGTVMNLLRQLAPDTLVILTSDNGAPDALQHKSPVLAPAPIVGSNSPFLGAKTTLWEGGVREPGIVWWPGQIQPRRTAAQASTLDVFATVVDAAGAAMPTDRTMDSVSLLPMLMGNTSKAPRQTHFLYRGRTLAAVRHKQWKVHLDTTKPTVLGDDVSYWAPFGVQSPWLLYNIEHDPSERYPVVDRADVLAEVEAVVKQHQLEMGSIPRGVLSDQKPEYRICCDQTTTPPCTCTPQRL